jgi:fused signal recognition particle receptor
MDIVIILVAVAAVVLALGVTVGIGLSRRREGPPGIEPPAPTGGARGGTLTAPAPGEVEGEVDVVEAPGAEAPPVEAPVRPTFRDRLSKARGTVSGYLTAIRSRKVDDETWDELEEALIRADVGVAATQRILGDLRTAVEADDVTDPEELLDRLKAQLKAELASGDRALHLDRPGSEGARPAVWLFVGVNGVGKTTTIGKVAQQQKALGRSVVMAAGDTFRAAAAEQLATWAERTGADIVRGSEGGDPSSVVFDAVQRGAARGHDIVLGDTAGRLHTKSNLMEELRKVRRVADRDPGTVTEVLLVLDATTGQNGLAQAQQFAEAVDLTGVVLTKLDGSAKGGIALAIQTTLDIPIKLVGLGETVADLVEFDPDDYVEALFA